MKWICDVHITITNGGGGYYDSNYLYVFVIKNGTVEDTL